MGKKDDDDDDDDDEKAIEEEQPWKSPDDPPWREELAAEFPFVAYIEPAEQRSVTHSQLKLVTRYAKTACRLWYEQTGNQHFIRGKIRRQYALGGRVERVSRERMADQASHEEVKVLLGRALG
jgi:hypothetical protein